VSDPEPLVHVTVAVTLPPKGPRLLLKEGTGSPPLHDVQPVNVALHDDGFSVLEYKKVDIPPSTMTGFIQETLTEGGGPGGVTQADPSHVLEGS
jgi:hypothetical protein